METSPASLYASVLPSEASRPQPWPLFRPLTLGESLTSFLAVGLSLQPSPPAELMKRGWVGGTRPRRWWYLLVVTLGGLLNLFLCLSFFTCKIVTAHLVRLFSGSTG